MIIEFDKYTTRLILHFAKMGHSISLSIKFWETPFSRAKYKNILAVQQSNQSHMNYDDNMIRKDIQESAFNVHDKLKSNVSATWAPK